MTPLSDERVKDLYRQFQAAELPSYYATWREGFLSCIEHFASLTTAQLMTPAEQERLWRARGISGIGPGDSVNVSSAYSDQEIASALAAVRGGSWPLDAPAKAKALQAHFEATLALVAERHAKKRPHAKLARAFTALLPYELDTCFSWRARQAAAELMLGKRGVGFIEGGILAADRLKRVLGDAKDDAEVVSRAQFLWWLTENKDDALAGSTVQPPAEVEELPPITPVAPTKLLRGFPAVTGYHEAFRATILAAQNGATAEDIVASLAEDLEGRSAKSRRELFNRVRRLGFLTGRGQLWFPSEEGEELLGSDPPDVLVQKILEQTFGLGHLLQLLDGGPRTSREAYEHLTSLYPNWSTNFMPSSIAAWGDALGLIEETDDAEKWRLSEYGALWLSRLPKHLAVPAREQGQAIVASTDQRSLELVPFEAIADRFANDPATKGLVVDPVQLRTLHAAWCFHPAKRFVLLSGLSGTGKTKVLAEYARLYCELCQSDFRQHRAIVAVSPSWRDPSGLLGYFNPLHEEPSFQPEPALRLAIDAARNPSAPYFLILDEMNLARAEQYFAPFLSAMETGDDLLIHAQSEPVNGVPPTITWPRNLFIGGTVNMDETTHPFSDKVLDRAFTLEFWEVNLPLFFSRRHDRGKRDDIAELVLREAGRILAGVRRHFGYRTAGECLDFVAAAAPNSNEDLHRAMIDRALFSKILPRLRGEDSPAMRDALAQLIALCREQGLPASERKLVEMEVRLASTSLTRFWA